MCLWEDEFTFYWFAFLLCVYVNFIVLYTCSFFFLLSLPLLFLYKFPFFSFFFWLGGFFFYMAISLMNNLEMFSVSIFLVAQFDGQCVVGDDGHNYIMIIFSYTRFLLESYSFV